MSEIENLYLFIEVLSSMYAGFFIGFFLIDLLFSSKKIVEKTTGKLLLYIIFQLSINVFIIFFSLIFMKNIISKFEIGFGLFIVMLLTSQVNFYRKIKNISDNVHGNYHEIELNPPYYDE